MENLELKREELLKVSILELSLIDNLGDSNCTICSGHGCLDDGNEFGSIMIHCPYCYTKQEIKWKEK